jgi:hypothetical protein
MTCILRLRRVTRSASCSGQARSASARGRALARTAPSSPSRNPAGRAGWTAAPASSCCTTPLSSRMSTRMGSATRPRIRTAAVWAWTGRTTGSRTSRRGTRSTLTSQRTPLPPPGGASGSLTFLTTLTGDKGVRRCGTRPAAPRIDAARGARAVATQARPDEDRRGLRPAGRRAEGPDALGEAVARTAVRPFVRTARCSEGVVVLGRDVSPSMRARGAGPPAAIAASASLLPARARPRGLGASWRPSQRRPRTCKHGPRQFRGAGGGGLPR